MRSLILKLHILKLHIANFNIKVAYFLKLNITKFNIKVAYLKKKHIAKFTIRVAYFLKLHIAKFNVRVNEQKMDKQDGQSPFFTELKDQQRWILNIYNFFLYLANHFLDSDFVCLLKYNSRVFIQVEHNPVGKEFSSRLYPGSMKSCI